MDAANAAFATRLQPLRYAPTVHPPQPSFWPTARISVVVFVTPQSSGPHPESNRRRRSPLPAFAFAPEIGPGFSPDTGNPQSASPS
jgi:hypothetical protein